MKVNPNMYIEYRETESYTFLKIEFGKPIIGTLISNDSGHFLKFKNHIYKLYNIDYPISNGSEEIIFYPLTHNNGKLYIKIIDFIGKKAAGIINSGDETKIASKLLEEMGLENNKDNLNSILKIFHGKSLGQDYFSLSKNQLDILDRLVFVFSIFQTGYKDNLPPSLIKIEKYNSRHIESDGDITKLNIFYESPVLGLINIKMEYSSRKKLLDIEFHSEKPNTLDLLCKNHYEIERLLKPMGFGVKLHYIRESFTNNIFDFLFIRSFNERI
ncbi:MAG: hypothetical protein QME46_10865 [Thermoanaerobacteraceae bacterium]|nr:hypothetical protein [Thermoanaerobacteraceae bacterium]